MRIGLQLGGCVFLLLGSLPVCADQQPAVKATTLLKTTTTVTGQKLEYPSKNPQVTATLAEVPPGGDVGWHQHPNIRYVYVLDGTLTIEMENGTRREYPAGSIFVEAYGTPHRGMNTGATPVKVLFIDHSEEGQPNMIKTEAPSPHHEGMEKHP